MPFCHLALRAPKPPPAGYPAEPENVGEHLRKTRLDQGLLQRELAEMLGVNPSTVQNWENGHTEPALRYWPAVIEFLGFVPFPVGDTLGDRIRAWRRVHGVPRNKLADRLGVDPTTVWRWETDEAQPLARHQKLITEMLRSLN